MIVALQVAFENVMAVWYVPVITKLNVKIIKEIRIIVSPRLYQSDFNLDSHKH